MSLEYLEFLGHLFSRFFIGSVFLVSIREPRGFEDRAEVAVALTMQGIGHCDLLTERECKDTTNPHSVVGLCGFARE